MTGTDNVIELQLWQADQDSGRINGHLMVPFQANFSPLLPQAPSLVMDPSRPTELGWKFVPPESLSFPNKAKDEFSHRLNLIGSHDGILSYRFWQRSELFETDIFVPPGEPTYVTRAEFDPGTNILWFPIPHGRSLHLLSEYFGFHEQDLAHFIRAGIEEQDEQFPRPFNVDHLTLCMDGDYEIPCHSNSDDTEDYLRIPGDLLRDPIRNGSEDPSHGFNPWNEDQKARILAHAKTEVVRLTDLFRQAATEQPLPG